MDDQGNNSLFSEILYYVKKYKRWWLLPLIMVFLIFGVLLFIGQVVPVVSPFIYTIF